MNLVKLRIVWCRTNSNPLGQAPAFERTVRFGEIEQKYGSISPVQTSVSRAPHTVKMSPSLSLRPCASMPAPYGTGAREHILFAWVRTICKIRFSFWRPRFGSSSVHGSFFLAHGSNLPNTGGALILPPSQKECNSRVSRSHTIWTLTGTIPIIAFFLGQKEYFRTKGVANSIPKLLVHRSIHWIEKDPYIPHFHRDVIKYVWYKECQNI